MRNPIQAQAARGGFTLIELTVVISILVVLMSTGIFFSSAIEDWKRGRDASETLRGVYVAQRSYIADNPTSSLSSLTQAKLLPYLPSGAGTFPTVTTLDGQIYSIKVTASPPVVVDGSGVTYDPSNNPKDSLWDVGE